MRSVNRMVCLTALVVNREAAVPKVVCAECGLLALRGVSVDGIFEANSQFRETGKPTAPKDVWTYHPAPLCFAQAIDLHKKLDGKSVSEVRDAIRTPIEDCGHFLPWTQGYSPKEHADMELQRQILELHRGREDADREWRMACDERDRVWREGQAEREQQWREQASRNDKEWRERQANDERQWREQQAKNEERRHRSNLIVYGLLAICAGLVGAAIQANWIPNFFSWLAGSSSG